MQVHMASRTELTDRENEKVLNYVHGRLGERTSAGQCILHVGPGGVIRKVEWREVDRVEDIIRAPSDLDE
jgi:hypothetical protein